MTEALALADRAARVGEVPVGCIIVNAQGEPIARAYNLREWSYDPTAHAEVVALRAASGHVGSWRLDGYTMYVTLEPCPMCAGALVNARISRVVWGCDDPKAGACVSLFRIGDDRRLNHRFEMTGGILREECAARLKSFFADRRKR